jgi:hypothetical protein
MLHIDAARLAREARWADEREEGDRAWRRSVWRLLAVWLAWYLVGTVVLVSSFAVHSQQYGDVVFWLGLCIGNIGALGTVMAFVIRASNRGDI